MAVGTAHYRYKLATAAAMSKWKEEVDKINPLDAEFIKRRIEIRDVVSPITGQIHRKRFVDCELIGPANVIMARDISMTNSTFSNCDMVVMKENCWIQTGIPVIQVEVYNCILFNCTVFIHQESVKTFSDMGANIVSIYEKSEKNKSPSVPS